jgi:hypothetical protein
MASREHPGSGCFLVLGGRNPLTTQDEVCGLLGTGGCGHEGTRFLLELFQPALEIGGILMRSRLGV